MTSQPAKKRNTPYSILHSEETRSKRRERALQWWGNPVSLASTIPCVGDEVPTPSLDEHIYLVYNFQEWMQLDAENSLNSRRTIVNTKPKLLVIFSFLARHIQKGVPENKEVDADIEGARTYVQSMVVNDWPMQNVNSMFWAVLIPAPAALVSRGIAIRWDPIRRRGHRCTHCAATTRFSSHSFVNSGSNPMRSLYKTSF